LKNHLFFSSFWPVFEHKVVPYIEANLLTLFMYNSKKSQMMPKSAKHFFIAKRSQYPGKKRWARWFQKLTSVEAIRLSDQNKL
jgi:hypothetical protein